MKKSLLFCLMAVVALFFAACGNNPEKNSKGTILLGWCTNDIDGTVGPNGNTTLKACVQIPDTQWVNKGTKITGIRIGLGDGTISNGQIWLSYEKESDPFYTQDFTYQGSGWQYIELNTPYKFESGKSVWIGYTVESGDYVIGYSVASNKNKLTDQIWIGSKWYRLGDAGVTGRLSIQAIVAGGDYSDMAQCDLVVSDLDYEAYVQQSATQTISGVVTNYGVLPVNGATLTFTDGTNSKTITIDEQMPNGKPIRFKFDNLTAGSGESEFTISASCDEQTTPSTTKGTQLFYNQSTPRKVLIEQFTGASCPNCPGGEETLTNSIASITDQVCWITHHVGYYEDDYTVSASKEYTWFYGTSGTYAPACMLDRTNPTAFGFSSDYPVFHPGYTTATMFNKYLAVPAFVSVNVSCSLAADSILSVTVSGEFLATLTGARMNVFLIQNHIYGYQSSGGDKYDHNHTVRARMTAAWGDEIEVNADGTYSMTFSYRIPENIRGTQNVDVPTDIDNMQVVAFVSRYTSSDRNNSQVFNCNIADVR
ncbi:MAG: Omp28-related outer membrane protein [Bacteroidales bacterium]|nr:Omp28-related outer membrane protein [Bacteroidales bacterium]